MKNLVIIQDNQAITTSLKVAEVFGKRHSDVLRTITNLYDKLSNEHKRNFAFSQNLSISAMFKLVSQNMKTPTGGIKNSRMYTMNRDGFVLLAMGFTGQKALEFKLAYITAFNQMEATLKQSLTVAAPANINAKTIGGIVKKCVNKALSDFISHDLPMSDEDDILRHKYYNVSDKEMMDVFQRWYWSRNYDVRQALDRSVQRIEELETKLRMVQKAIN